MTAACCPCLHLAGLDGEVTIVDLGLYAVVEAGQEEEGEQAGGGQWVHHLPVTVNRIIILQDFRRFHI